MSKNQGKGFIKHYDSITAMLKTIFYYGTYSEKDMKAEKGFEHSKYHDDMITIRYVFGDMLVEHTNEAGKKAYSLRNDYFEDPQRLFTKFFALRSIAMDKLIVSCYVLQRLYRSRQPLAFREFKDEVMKSPYMFNDKGERLFSKRTLTKWVNDMVVCGLLQKQGSNMDAKYTVGDDLLCEGRLSRPTRDHLLLLTDFCSNVLPLSVCGGAIRHKLDMKYRSPFLFKHRYIGHFFHDDTIRKLLVYIAARQPVGFVYKDEDHQQGAFLPYRIVTDKASGRQYLFAVCIDGDLYTDYLLRIDKLAEITPSDKPCVIPTPEALAQRYAGALRSSFAGLYLPRGRKRHMVTGRLTFRNDAKEEVLRRFPDAVIVPSDETHSSTEIQVYKMNELKPWLRSRIDRIRLTESSDGTALELKKEAEEWRKMYGID